MFVLFKRLCTKLTKVNDFDMCNAEQILHQQLVGPSTSPVSHRMSLTLPSGNLLANFQLSDSKNLKRWL